MTDSPTYTAARCCWEVTAGLIPGQDPDPEFTRQFWMTSTEANADNNREIWLAKIAEATEYYQSLLDPSQLNWVRLDWVWF